MKIQGVTGDFERITANLKYYIDALGLVEDSNGDWITPYKETILQEAQRIVYGDRAKSHGDFRDNFVVASNLYNGWTGQNISVANAIQMLICLKMARQKATPNGRDHYVDIAGYVELLGQLKEV